MILAHGVLLPNEQLEQVLSGLEAALNRTLSGPRLDPMVVVQACDRLAQGVESGKYAKELRAFTVALEVPEIRIREAISLFRRDSLLYKLKLELGEQELEPLEAGPKRWARRRFPLGTLFHIAAGNVDGLPAYSVVEGLLAGNINLLKLPSADGGLSVALLHALIQEAPELADYIYVFDLPSTQVESLTRLAGLADGVVVWGGDQAVQAARRMARPGTKVICWGHKLSFAYAVPQATDEDLEALALHICETRQVLCTSCQGVYVDSQDMAEINALAERLLAALKQAARQFPTVDPGLRGQATLRLYTEQLEAAYTGRRVLKGDGVSVLVCPEDELELSFLHGNCWVKPLPRSKLIATLRRKKEYLQTAGLLCPPEERAELTELLARAGVNRITGPGDMSRTVAGEAHDGGFPLRAYSRVVEGLWDLK